MFEANLFYGIPLNSHLLKKYNTIPAKKRALFIRDHDDYLQEMQIEDETYLGKKLGKMASLKSLELSEKNIITLLKKIFPDAPIEEQPIYLKTLFEPNE